MTAWQFVGGPLDGYRLVVHQDLLAPMVVEVQHSTERTVTYELTAKPTPDTLVYTPREHP